VFLIISANLCYVCSALDDLCMRVSWNDSSALFGIAGPPFPVQHSSIKIKGEVCEIEGNNFNVPLSVSLGRKVINSNVCVYHKLSRLSVVLQKYSSCAVVWPF
jgi:hypothetical protein